jgi:hypothetical protein
MKLVTKNQNLFDAYCKNKTQSQKENSETVMDDLLPDNWLERLQKTMVFNDSSIKNNDREYAIVFESFNTWSSFKETFKFKGHDNKVYYDNERKYIGLNKKVLEDKDYLYHRNYKDKLSVKDFAIQAIFHEIGHLIHDETMRSQQKKYVGQFLSSSESWANDLNALCSSSTTNMVATVHGNYLVDKSMIKEIKQTVSENFAELFAMAAITLCTTRENAIKLMEIMYEKRHNDEKQGYAYQLSGAMNQFLTDFKNGKEFNNLDELKDYIGIQTQKTVYKHTEQLINDSRYMDETLYFLGVLNKAMNINKTQMVPFLRTLEAKWGIKVPVLQFTNNTNYQKINDVFVATGNETYIGYSPKNKESIQDKIAQIRQDNRQNQQESSLSNKL